jgi:uncharacterized membrane protein YfcA
VYLGRDFQGSMKMDISTLIILVLIGIAAGILSGFIGLGGGIIIVPALIYFMGFSQLQAQGTSLAIMLPPIGIMAVMNYYKSGNVNLVYALIIALTFIIGGYFGSKIALRISPTKVKFAFGLIMFYSACRMLWASGQSLFFENNGG